MIGKITAPLQVFYRGDEEGAEKVYRVGVDGSGKTLVFDNPDENKVIEAMEVSPDMTRLAFTYGKSIHIIDLSTGQNTTLTQGAVTTPTWSQDNREVVFSRQQLGLEPYQEIAQLYKVSVLGGVPIKLTESAGPGFLERDPAWSPEGGLITLGSTRDGDFDIWLVDANSGKYLLNLTDGNVGTDGKPAIESNPAFGWMP